jgi:hypothetical protein
MSNSMTIRELYIKILQTIDQITEGFLKFFMSMAYKLYTKQFLELTIDQVGVIVLILIIFCWLGNLLGELGIKLIKFLDKRILPSVENRWLIKYLVQITVIFIGVSISVFFLVYFLKTTFLFLI